MDAIIDAKNKTIESHGRDKTFAWQFKFWENLRKKFGKWEDRRTHPLFEKIKIVIRTCCHKGNWDHPVISMGQAPSECGCDAFEFFLDENDEFL